MSGKGKGGKTGGKGGASKGGKGQISHSARAGLQVSIYLYLYKSSTRGGIRMQKIYAKLYDFYIYIYIDNSFTNIINLSSSLSVEFADS